MRKRTALIIMIIFTFINIINAEDKAVDTISSKPSSKDSKKTEEYLPEKNTHQPNVSFGIVGTFGTQIPIALYGSIKFEPGYSYGGGFVIEKMFTSKAGIHTGLYFTESISPYTMNFTPTPTSAIMRMGMISIPVYFIGSYNKSFFSLQMLAGVTLTQLLYSITSVDFPLTSSSSYAENIHNMSQFMAGPGVGLNFKFRVSSYFDLYFGFITTFYFQNFVPRAPDTYAFLYDAKITTGFMFRTNLFPEKEDWRWK